MLVKENQWGAITICNPHNSLKLHYFVPRACYIIAVIKVAIIFVVRSVFSLIHEMGENPIKNMTAQITPWILETLTAYIFVTVHFRNIVPL